MASEDDAISALTGFSLNRVLDGLQLPSSAGLTNQLGISGIPSLNSSQIYNDKWDDDEEAVGPDQGEDWEAEIDREMEEEEESDDQVKKEVPSPTIGKKGKRIRVVKRMVERPPTVEERFPTFSKDRILDFSELFKGHTVRKSRLSKRPYQSASTSYSLRTTLTHAPKLSLFTLENAKCLGRSLNQLSGMHERTRQSELKRWFQPGMLKATCGRLWRWVVPSLLLYTWC